MGEAFHPSQTEINRQAQDVPTALNLDINQPIENNSLQATEAAKQTDESSASATIQERQVVEHSNHSLAVSPPVDIAELTVQGVIDKVVKDQAEAALIGLHPEQSDALAQWIYKNDLNNASKEWPGFNPRQQVGEIMHLSGNERQVALDRLNQNYLLHKQNIANLYLGINADIEQDQNITDEKLIAYAQAEAERLGLNDAEKNELAIVVQRFIDRRAEVRQLRSEHPDDPELFYYLFNFHPKGKIVIDDYALSLHVLCYDDEDYAKLHACAGQPFVPEMHTIDTNRSLKTQAFSSKVRGYITVERVQLSKQSDTIAFLHEAQHAKHQLRIGKSVALDTPDIQRTFKLNDYYNNKMSAEETTSDERLDLIPKILRTCRMYLMDIRAKDEILAFITNQNLTAAELKSDLTDWYGVYGYYRNNNGYEPLIKTVFADLNLSPKEDLHRRMSMQAIFVDEYQSLINLSVEVVVNLVKLGYPIDTIISLLTAEPLDQWPALELRLVRELVGVSKARAKLLVGH